MHDLLLVLERFSEGKESGSIVLTGPSGSGKSHFITNEKDGLLLKVVESLAKNMKKTEEFYMGFFEMNPSDTFNLLRYPFIKPGAFRAY